MLGEKEAPYEPILKLVSAQLAIAPTGWELYAARDETRREHLAELLPRMGMEQFAATHYRSLAAWLEPTALQTTHACGSVTLAKATRPLPSRDCREWRPPETPKQLSARPLCCAVRLWEYLGAMSCLVE